MRAGHVVLLSVVLMGAASVRQRDQSLSEVYKKVNPSIVMIFTQEKEIPSAQRWQRRAPIVEHAHECPTREVLRRALLRHGSWGFQAGGQVADIVLVLTTRRVSKASQMAS